MIKKIRLFVVATVASVMLLSVPVGAANHEFSFSIEDVNTTKDYKETWTKSDNEGYWYLTLNKSGGFLKNSTISSTNIFECKMRDLTIGPVVDDFREYSSHVSKERIKYRTGSNGSSLAKKGHSMQLRGRKSKKSTSTKTLKVYGKCAP